MIRKLAIALIPAAFLATPLLAQGDATTEDQTMAGDHMILLDTDGDGMVSYDEFIAVHADVTPEAFAELDTTGDGWLDAAEVTAAVIGGSITLPVDLDD